MNPPLTPKDSGYRAAMFAILTAGLASFNALYCTQVLLPAFTHDLGVSPATASLTVSATTGMLALSIVPASILSERFGRRRVIIASALIATIMGAALPFAPNVAILIILRGLQGLALAGVPATAMTYLSEEIAPEYLSRCMGLYIAGTTIGGLTGRILPAVVLEFANWRVALGSTVIFAFAVSLYTAKALPRQRRFTPRHLTFRGEFAAVIGHCKNPQLAMLYIMAFLFMGSFVSLYNYLGYRLITHFHLSEALAGAVFLLYLSGTLASAKAGSMIARFGHGAVVIGSTFGMIIGLALALSPELISTIIGVLIFTFGFFSAHSAASSWVGLTADDHRAEASSMYLFAYYMGSSIVGWLTGHIFHSFEWSGAIIWLIALVTLAIPAAWYLRQQARREAQQKGQQKAH